MYEKALSEYDPLLVVGRWLLGRWRWKKAFFCLLFGDVLFGEHSMEIDFFGVDDIRQFRESSDKIDGFGNDRCIECRSNPILKPRRGALVELLYECGDPGRVLE